MSLQKFRLDGKTAVITGASRGIGRAIALGMAGAGARVVLASRKLEDLEKVAEEIRDQGGDAWAVSAHNGKIPELENLVQKAVDRFGTIDVLVNNAATNPVFGPVLQVEEQAWDKIMEVNLKGVFFLCKAVARVMEERGGGTIINIASSAGVRPAMGRRR